MLFQASQIGYGNWCKLISCLLYVFEIILKNFRKSLDKSSMPYYTKNIINEGERKWSSIYRVI